MITKYAVLVTKLGRIRRNWRMFFRDVFFSFYFMMKYKHNKRMEKKFQNRNNERKWYWK